MKTVRAAAPQLADIEPYDPKYIPADVMISANENPCNVPFDVRRKIEHEVRKLELNRYPDPLAGELRQLIAEANGLDANQVLIGNGGDELLFNTALVWGGPGRTFLNLPPTFSVYVNNAQLTNTRIVEVPRRADYTIDEEAVLARVAEGDIDFTIITSPNNPTGDLASFEFVQHLLDATDALVMVDEAYFEFSRYTMRPLLETHKNLVILRTFSKAFSLAGVRVGYLLGDADVLNEYKRVRQPYSVNAISQVIAQVVYENRRHFEPGVSDIIDQRAVVFDALQQMPGVEVWPSNANFILFRVENAADVWQKLLDAGVLVRSFAGGTYTRDCLRVSIGTADENARFLDALRAIIEAKTA